MLTVIIESSKLGENGIYKIQYSEYDGSYYRGYEPVEVTKKQMYLSKANIVQTGYSYCGATYTKYSMSLANSYEVDVELGEIIETNDVFASNGDTTVSLEKRSRFLGKDVLGEETVYFFLDISKVNIIFVLDNTDYPIPQNIVFSYEDKNLDIERMDMDFSRNYTKFTLSLNDDSVLNNQNLKIVFRIDMVNNEYYVYDNYLFRDQDGYYIKRAYRANSGRIYSKNIYVEIIDRKANILFIDFDGIEDIQITE